jgi:putative FmdB family regulatory protein
MPTYSYVCKACEHSFDLWQEFSAEPEKVCPECGGEIRKVFGQLGVSFKGSGFYRTDSRGAGGDSSSPSTSKKSD